MKMNRISKARIRICICLIDGAIRMIENAESGLSVLDPDYEELYHKNANRAIEELTALRDELLAKASILNGKRAAILAEPLFYVAKMYGMDAVCTVERECGTSTVWHQKSRRLSECACGIAG